MKLRVAIVTGASSGLGAEFVRHIARRNDIDEIWAIARRKERLESLAIECGSEKVKPIVLDLSYGTAFEVISARLQKENPHVKLLVNNAGLGRFGLFAEIPLKDSLGQVSVNMAAVVTLSHMVLPYCQAGSALLQVASSLGFTPTPKFAVYAATKAFVLNFSDALGFELRDQGIRVISICPGPIETEFLTVAATSPVNGVLAPPKAALPPVTPRAIVLKAFDDLEKGRRHSVYGFIVKIFVICAKLFPRAPMLWILWRRKNGHPQK